MKAICQEIETSIPSATPPQIYFINPSYRPEDKSDYCIAKLNIDDTVGTIAKTIIRDIVSEIAHKQSIPINEIDKSDEDYIITVPFIEITSLVRHIIMIKKEMYKTFNPHNCDKFLENLKFYIVQLTINQKEYFFVKRHSVNKLIVPKQVMLIFKENTFEHIEKSNIFVLENNFDFFIVGDKAYLINEKQFSLMTGYYEKEKSKAENLLDEIEGLNIIADFSKLRDFCTDRISYIKRLSKLDDKDTLSKISFEKILDLKKKRGTDFIIDKSNKTISFSDNQQLKNIIDLILDNFVISEVTGERYRALNKYKDGGSGIA